MELEFMEAKTRNADGAVVYSMKPKEPIKLRDLIDQILEIYATKWGNISVEGICSDDLSDYTPHSLFYRSGEILAGQIPFDLLCQQVRKITAIGNIPGIPWCLDFRITLK